MIKTIKILGRKQKVQLCKTGEIEEDMYQIYLGKKVSDMTDEELLDIVKNAKIFHKTKSVGEDIETEHPNRLYFKIKNF